MKEHTKRLEKLDADEVYSGIKLAGMQETLAQLRKFSPHPIEYGTLDELNKITSMIMINGDKRFQPKTEDALREGLSQNFRLSFNYLNENNNTDIDTKNIAECVISEMFKAAKDKGLNLTQKLTHRSS